jgi:hypothetical protein
LVLRENRHGVKDLVLVLVDADAGKALIEESHLEWLGRLMIRMARVLG